MAIGVCLFFFLFLDGHEFVTGATLPPEFKRCDRNDPEIDICVKEAAQKALSLLGHGIPNLKVLPTDPLHISKLVIEDAPNRPVSLNLIVTNAQMRGLSNVKINSVKADLENRHVKVDVLVPYMNLTGDYIMDGKFLILPLKGNGKVYSEIENSLVKIQLKAESRIADGDTFWQLKNFTVALGDVTKFRNQFSNLFNGDESLAKPTIQAINTNWKEFWEAVRPALDVTFGVIFQNIAENIFNKVPERHMFL